MKTENMQMKSDSSGEAKPRRRASGFFVRAEGGAARAEQIGA